MHNKVKTHHTYEKKIPPRIGKTKKDHESGKAARTIQNRASRASEQQSRSMPKSKK